MYRVLLNVTPLELQGKSGDLSFLRDLCSLSSTPDSPLRYQTFLKGQGPVRDLRKVFWHLAHWWEPQWFRRATVFNSQRNHVLPRMIPEGPVDIFHTHLFLPWNVEELRQRWPIVFSSAGLSPPGYYRYIGHGLYRDVVAYYDLVGKNVDRILVWTQACARRLKQACPSLSSLVEVVPPFYQVEERSAEDKPGLISAGRETRFLFIGKDPCRKGLPEAAKAFLKASQQNRSITLTVVSENVPSQIRSLMAHNRQIRFFPSLLPREKCLKLMWDSDVLVLPTHAETIGTVLVEAMACCCAVISSDYEPLNEVAPEGKVGFQVRPGDVAALARKMELLSSSPSLLRKMQRQARRHYEEVYSLSAVLPLLISAYQRAIQHHRQAFDQGHGEGKRDS